jgi:FkbM family methyltransferase
MVKKLLKLVIGRLFYPEGAIRTILMGPCKGLRYRIFPGYGLSPLRGGWEPEAQALMVKYIRKSSIVYDVGANYGIHTLLMARLASEGRVYAFEPMPQIFRCLQENVDLNQFTNVTFVPLALSDRTGRARFVVGHHAGAGHIENVDATQGSTLSLDTITLDEFVYDHGNSAPTFMKIDVEGAESMVLLGATQVLHNAKPIILLDLHNPSEDVAVGEILLRHGYEAYRTNDGQKVKYLNRGWPEPDGIWGQFLARPT